ncbi:hypothetical protein [Amycolatopsis silviterrae]|uniref:Transcriptional regulator, AbiEi antitoxin, Type IV TA system n=1 Tax=Amycolatopsis silviterrae TaxID=1656914 RepID=A0ABW5H1P9_9PSEU
MKQRGRWAANPEIIAQHSTHQAIRAMTLESLGMNSKVIYRRCLPGGTWQRLLPGVILLHNNDPTPDQLVHAALLYAGESAIVTGEEACLRYGLRLPSADGPRQVHLLVPHRKKLNSAEFVTIERTRYLPAPWQRDGVPLAPIVRAATDLVRRTRNSESVSRILIEAIQRGSCSPQALAEELNRGSQRGTAIPRRLLAEWSDVRSVAEAEAQKLAALLPNPPTHQNAVLYDRSGGYAGRPDFWWDDVGLAWEIDSVEFHFRSADYARTLRRNTRYAALGIAVVQTLPSRLRTEPKAVLDELSDAYRAAETRPRPPVSLHIPPEDLRTAG